MARTNKIPKSKLRAHYDAPAGFISINREYQIDVINKPQKMISLLNEDKRYWVNLFNNFFSKYGDDFVPGDLQFDGNIFPDCPSLLTPLRKMGDLAVENNNPLDILGRLKFYLEKYEPTELEQIEAEEILEENKKNIELMNISGIATRINQERGGALAEIGKYKKGSAIQVNDSPINNAENLRSILGKITPDMKWGVNMSKGKAWLELSSTVEAESIVAHFKGTGYKNINLMQKPIDNTPVILLEPLVTWELAKITPMLLLQNNLSKNLII